MDFLQNTRPVIFNVKHVKYESYNTIELFNPHKITGDGYCVKSGIPDLLYTEICANAQLEKLVVKFIIIDVKKGHPPPYASLVKRNIFGDSSKRTLETYQPSAEYPNIFYCRPAFKKEVESSINPIIDFQLDIFKHIELNEVPPQSEYEIYFYIEHKNE